LTVRVVCDTASDIPSELADELGIVLVPLHVRFGDVELVDREQLSTKDFWARCRSSQDLPETAAPAPGAFASAFDALASAGASGIVCVTLSSKLSASNAAAEQAAREYAHPPVRVVDSLSVTMGEGMVCIAAAEAAAAGAQLDEVVAAAGSVKDRLSVFGAIDTLDNLRKGGRIGGAAAALGTLLSIKPVIEVRNGVVEQESRQRTRARSLHYLSDKLHAAAPVERLSLLGADAPDLADFARMVSDVQSDKPPVIADIGPVVGTHAGPGAIGVAWVRKKDRG
jgi:DegV family protein with EDD domain